MQTFRNRTKNNSIGEMQMLKDLFYMYYYRKFMKENAKEDKHINWTKWNNLDKICERLIK
jgi:hypothetical protein